jgi:hypothetical protein
MQRGVCKPFSGAAVEDKTPINGRLDRIPGIFIYDLGAVRQRHPQIGSSLSNVLPGLIPWLYGEKSWFLAQLSHRT